MTEDDRNGHSRTAQADRTTAVPGRPARRTSRRGLFRRRPRRRRIRWLRMLAVLLPVCFLALISFVFGIVLAFEPQIGNLAHRLYVRYKDSNSVNTLVYGDKASGHKELAILSSHTRQFFLDPTNVPPVLADAIVSIEDKRFYTESGVDFRGIARAFLADVMHSGGTQGASTITEQFVKIALNQQSHRTILEKLREAALAFQLSHKWSKQKILAEYLNVAYFGSGAYGAEAAARAYFGNDPNSPLYRCGANPNNKNPESLCVTHLTADEAALLAAAVNAPSDFNGLLNARNALDRRNLVLGEMAQQGYLTTSQAQQAELTSLPPPGRVESPSEEATDPSAGYFTSWIAGQLVDHLHYRNIAGGGYRVYTTLDTDLQKAAQRTVDQILPPGIRGPSAAMVVIQTNNGAVRAMVGGYNYNKDAYNLATLAERQPGSAFKAFDLAVALESGHFSYSRPILSAPFTYPAGQEWSAGLGPWVVHNDERSYVGAPIPLWEALAESDNSVFARVGLSPAVGPPRIAQVAHQFGITTTVSLNPSMVIGGLHEGVTPLDMTHAYETIANGGQLATGTLTSYGCAGGPTNGYLWEGVEPKGNHCPGAVGITSIISPDQHVARNRSYAIPVAGYSAADDRTEIAMMRKVISPIGTAAAAEIPGVAAWGKTGTTNNYVDAWFCGSIPTVAHTPALTACVWVGYPNGYRPMARNFGGHPVYGGTFPAQIWHKFMLSAMTIYNRRAHGLPGTPSTHHHASTGASTTTSTTTTPATTTPSTGASGATTGTTAPTGATSTGATNAPATGTTDAGGANAPTTGTTAATGATTGTTGGGGTGPGTTTPSTTTPPTTTPSTSTPGTTTPSTTTPGTTTPSTTTPGGGVTAPTGGAAAPSGT